MVLISLISMVDTVMVSGLGTDAVAVVGLVNQPRMIFAGAEEGRTLEPSTDYFMILGCALPFQALSMGLCAAQRGVGNTKLTMQVNITSNIVNVIFNYLLINGVGPFPKLGVHGAALATALGMVVGFALSVRAIFHDRNGFLMLSFHDSWKPDMESGKALVQVGSSAMVEQLAMRASASSPMPASWPTWERTPSRRRRCEVHRPGHAVDCDLHPSCAGAGWRLCVPADPPSRGHRAGGGVDGHGMRHDGSHDADAPALPQ